MTIVPIGNLLLQVPQSDHPGFTQELCTAILDPIRQVIGRCLEEALETEIERWLGRKPHVRRRRIRPQEVAMQCRRCFTHQRCNFQRNGHYRRALDTHWGRVMINVPQVICICGGSVPVSFRTIRRGQRLWDDLTLEVQVQYGQGLSYRQIKADWDARLGSSLGLRTLNQSVLARAAKHEPCPNWCIEKVPPVVRLDGIWITVMFPTGKTQTDRLGRQRMVKQAKKVPILAAQGVWPLTGQTRLLAWTRAEGEDTASWQQFLEQLFDAGITCENGLALLVSDGAPGLLAARENVYWQVPLQRCVFHKLRNVAQTLSTPSGLDRQAGQYYRTQFLRQAAHIWQASDEMEARQRYAAFCQRWQSQQPKAIQTLRRDFDATLAFYTVQEQAAERNEDWPAYRLRTTSPLERTFRDFRRRYRLAVVFHSEAGACATTSQLAVRFS
jgi:transposase-like protein